MKTLFLVALVATAAACGDDNPDPGGPTCLPDCAAARTYDAKAYHLAAHYDWSANQLVAVETIELDTTASGPIVELDSAVTVSAVHDLDGAALPYRADTTAGTLHVDLTKLADTDAKFVVEYTASPTGSGYLDAALIPTASRDDDPCTSRVVYTDSEPNRALQWLVVKLDPSDRALWSDDITVAADEDVVSNGVRTADATTADGRTVSYALDQPIPPYLMAFAAGQLDHTDRPTGSSVPISVWYRKGFALDPNGTLDAIADSMATFESLVGPYPWKSYAVVLLPYGGGMENATITFDNETSGQGPIDFTLVAHELAHHWFGDWVTMNRYEDVWFKEGMATVLESVADRARRDGEGKGREFGIDYAYTPQDAIVDASLTGIDKYTSGPYQHAAWLITQIRGKVGDTAFWTGLKKLLADHGVGTGNGSATGEQFIRSFVDLDEATVQQLLAALPTTDTPQLAVGVTGRTATFTLTDPSGIMLDPITVTTIGADGAATDHSIAVGGGAVTVTVDDGGYLAFDEVDRTPPLTYDMGVQDDSDSNLETLFTPAQGVAPAVLAAFESRSATQQERAFDVPVGSDGWSAYLAALDSTFAKQTALEIGCYRAGQGDAPWAAAVAADLKAPPREGIDYNMVGCGTAFPMAQLEGAMASSLAAGTPASLAHVEYLLSFDYGDDAVAVIGPVVKTAPTLRLRDLALARLSYQLFQQVGYTEVSPAQVPAWKALFEGELAANISENRFVRVVRALGYYLADPAALAQVGQLMHAPQLDSYAQLVAACSMYSFAQGTDRTTFETAAMPYDTLAAEVQTVMTSHGASGCNNFSGRGVAAPNPRTHHKPR